MILTAGGKEFAEKLGRSLKAVTYHHASFEALQAKAEKLCDAACNTVVRYDRKNISFTVSMGIALCPENGKTLDEVLQVADAALYRAKEGGRTGSRMKSDRQAPVNDKGGAA